MNTDIASIETGARRGPNCATAHGRAGLLCLLAVAALGVGGCASKDTTRSGLLEPYRTDLPQGNYLTREQVDQVRQGMSRDQVRFILGTPLLGHVFHTDRWDYVFMLTHPNGQTELRRVTVHFDHDAVASIDADPLPLREDANDPALPGYRPPKPGTTTAASPPEAPVRPAEAPVQSEAPVQPAEAPVQPAEAPVVPAEAPVQRTETQTGAEPASEAAPTATPTATPTIPGAGVDTDKARIEGNPER